MTDIVVDAADFIGHIKEGYSIADNRRFPGEKLHNNIGLLMDYPQFKTKDHRVRKYGQRGPISHVIEPIKACCDVPESGTYHLFVRSCGQEKSGFKVSVNGRMDPNVFGTSEALVGRAAVNGHSRMNRHSTVNGHSTMDGHSMVGGHRAADRNSGDSGLPGLPSFSWKRGGSYDLQKGTVEIALHVIAPEPCLDVIVLTTDESFDGNRLPENWFPDEVELLREYEIPGCNAVKFGVLTSDGRMGFVAFGRDWSASAYDYDGRQLWRYEAPPLEAVANNRAAFEPPGVIWDLDRDGRGEVIHWRYIDGKARLVMADGETGEVKRMTEFPSVPPDACNNYRIAVARLEPGYPQHIIVLADSGGIISIIAYDSQLRQAWQHIEHRKKDNLGHYIYPRDINSDGVDEILVGALALSSKGEVLWNRLKDDNNLHIDSIRFADIDGDGREEVIAVYSELGVYALNALTGKTLWSAPAEHAQQVEVGKFLKGVPGIHIAAGARIYSSGKHYLYSQIYWYDSQGRLIKRWPETSLNGNPDFAKADWKGDGRETLFWYRFMIEDDGTGTLCFPDQVYHAFDFTGSGAEDVITLDNGRLRVYGSRSIVRKPDSSEAGRTAKRNTDYMYRKVANHTHY